MALFDPSVVVLILVALNKDATTAFQLPHNEDFVVSAGSVEKGSQLTPSHHSRETTPLIESPVPTLCVLRTTHYPIDPCLGWVFGSNEERCDFLLGRRKLGISGRQFRIDFNWKETTLVLSNISRRGTRVIDALEGIDEKIQTSIVIVEGHQMMIRAGTVELMLSVPNRHRRQAQYEKNVKILRQEAELAVPGLTGLGLESATETPLVMGDGADRKFITVGGVIGTGATAYVQRVVDRETGDMFAAKVFNGNFTKSYIAQMFQEIKRLQKVSHDHIISYVSLFKDPDPVLVMELAVCHLSEQTMSGTDKLVIMLKQILSALAYLHDQHGITHRDVKPENILLGRGPSVWKLADFGLSSDALLMGTFCGTPFYVAPEICTGDEYTSAVDIWSLGVVVVQFSCGLPDSRQVKPPKRIGHDLDHMDWFEAVHMRAQQGDLADCTRQMLCMSASERASAEHILNSWDDQTINTSLEQAAVLPRGEDTTVTSAKKGTTILDEGECSTVKLLSKEWTTVLREEEHSPPMLRQELSVQVSRPRKVSSQPNSPVRAAKRLRRGPRHQTFSARS